MSIRFALRTLFKAPFVTGVAVLSLALGLGANSAIFSMFDQMLLRSLSVREPEDLVNLASAGPQQGSNSCNQSGDCDEVFSYPMFRDLERKQDVFAGIAAHRIFEASVESKGRTETATATLVSGSYFPVLGLQPALGRLLDAADDRAVGAGHVAVLSHEYWRTRFGADPAVLNDRLVLNGQALTVVGVAPRGFDGTTLGTKVQAFVPITLRGFMEAPFDGFEDRKSYWAYLFARLKPGVSPAQASAAVNVPYHAILNDVEAPLQKGMSDQTLARFRAKTLTLRPGARGQSEMHRETRAPLVTLLVVTGVVLLIACANIANLLLARSVARSGEIAVRLAIGANRRQLVSQLMLEACVLAAMGGAAGLLVARWTVALITSLLPADTASSLSFGLDLRAVAFTAALALATGLLFGLFPALHASRTELAHTLKGQAGQPSGSRAAARFRTGLVTTQIALSMALLVSSGLFLKSLVKVSQLDLGLRIEDLVTFRLSPGRIGYKPERSRAFLANVEQELRGVPGVRGIATGLIPLLGGSNWGSNVAVQGFEAGPDTDSNARYNEVGPGYFGTLGIPLMSGREFTASDGLGAPKVAVVNEAFTQKFGLGRDAVGKWMKRGRKESGELDTEIVGVVQNAKYSEVKETIPPLFFTPLMQDEGVGEVSFYVRTGQEPEQFLKTISSVMARIAPDLPVDDLRTMPQQARQSVFLDRFISTVASAFALLATLLAAVGLYGVLAYTVAQRTREFGLRMALGADGSNVRSLVLSRVLLMTLAGGAIGMALAVAVAQASKSLLYEVKGHDPVVLVGSVILLGVVAVIAGFVPARRASRIDPMRALRYE